MASYNKDEVAEIIENEGLGYAVTEYMSSEHIEDPELATLWRIARAALQDIEDFLET